MTEKSDVLIIGGGAIGICTAYYLLKSGRSVTILEQNEIASGSSYGNAGLIVPSLSIPLASPGVIADGIKWMFDKKSPFYIKPRLDFDLLSWLWQFIKHCNSAQMVAGFQVLKEIGFQSLALLEELVSTEQLDCEYHRQGWLMVYRTEEKLRHALEEAQFLEDHGVEARVFGADETLAFEPCLLEGLQGSVFFPHEAHLNPAAFVTQLAKRVQAEGCVIHTHTQALELEIKNGSAQTVKTNQGDFTAEQVVCTNGAWAGKFMKDLGVNLLVQPAKGYSISLENVEKIPQRPLYLSENKVAVTPYTHEVRLAGTLELTGMELDINTSRVEGILAAGKRFMHLSGEENALPPWAGLRPCTPDGIPIISVIKEIDNLFLSTGHCMMGITLAPITGKLFAQLINREKPDMSLDTFSAYRF